MHRFHHKTAKIILCLMFPLSIYGDELEISPKPYIKMLNAKASEFYSKIKAAKPEMSTTNGIYLKKGQHKITVKGREKGSRLKALWIGPVHSTPYNKTEEYLDISKATISGPMKIRTKNNVKYLESPKYTGKAVLKFNIPADGNYQLWGEGGALDYSSNSFLIQIDDKPEIIWDIPVNKRKPWKWSKISGRSIAYFSSWNFIITWGACAKNSKLRNNKELRSLAFNLCKATITNLSKRRVQPVQLWFLADLEAVRLWQLDKRTNEKDINELMKLMKPYVNSCLKMVEKHEGWRDNTPNIQLQAAAILALGAEIWKKKDPDTAEVWKKTSYECLKQAWKWKDPNGPFMYSYGSGIDATYFSYDAKHLCCIYRLTKDPRVKQALIDMLAFANNTSSFGHPLSSGSPWWKHTYNSYDRQGNLMLPLQILELSGNSKYAELIALDGKRQLKEPYPDKLDWLIPYYNAALPTGMYNTSKIKNGSFFSSIENGPVLRWNSYNVAMPYRNWSESTCGVFYSTADKVESQLCSIILTAIDNRIPGAKSSAHYPVAYSVIKPGKKIYRRTFEGENFVVAVTSFLPEPGGPALPSKVGRKYSSPWQRTDIWFGCPAGIIGILKLKAIEDNKCSKVALWTHLSNNFKISGKEIKLPGMNIKLADSPKGKIKRLGKTWGFSGGFYPLELLECEIASSSQGFKRKVEYQAIVTAAFTNGVFLSVAKHSIDDGLERIMVNHGSEKYAEIIINNNKKPKTVSINETSKTIMPESITAVINNGRRNRK